MAKYTLRGSAALDALIDRHMRRIAEAVEQSPAGPHCRALILLGGYGRGEGSPLIVHTPQGEEEHPFNDYDLIAVMDRLTPALRQTLRALEESLSAELGLPVDLFPYRTADLPRCEFSLLNYEMKYGHRIIRGDPDALATLPAWPHGTLPLAEGTRLLLNRGKLLLDIRRRLTRPDPLSPDERITFIKFLFKAGLAFGDCALLLRKEYDLSYAVKKEQLRTTDLRGLPDDGAPVRAAFQAAVAFKERTDFRELEHFDVAAEYEKTAALFLAFFRWYETRRLGAEYATPWEYLRLARRKESPAACLKGAVQQLRFFRKIPGGGNAPLFAPPRLRLYAALPLLLQKEPTLPQLRQLLNAPATADFEETAQAFYRLRLRFA